MLFDSLVSPPAPRKHSKGERNMESAGKAQFGKFFLIRIRDNATAVRLIERTTVGDSDGGAKYEWYCQSDGSTDLSRNNIVVGKGEVFEKRIPMYDKLRDMQYSKLEGERFIKCEPISIQWTIGGADGDWVYFPDKRENDISIVMTEWDRLSDVDFYDSRLQWKTMMRNTSLEKTPSGNKLGLEDVQSIPLQDRYWSGSPIALFLFNSDVISKQVSTAYGQYAEGELLKSLSKALQPDGGWMSLKSSLVGFHGDIGNVDILGEPTPFVKLRSYLTDVAYGMSVTTKDLDSAFLEQLKWIRKFRHEKGHN